MNRWSCAAVDLDDEADDGEAGEGDDVHASVDIVIGGAEGDRLAGIRLRLQHGAVVGGRDRLDAIHARDVAHLRHGRERRSTREPLQRRRRDLLERALPACLGRTAHYRRALFTYNHAWWYVNKVLAAARRYR